MLSAVRSRFRMFQIGILFGLVVLPLVIFFENCTSHVQHSETSAPTRSGGIGIDGKIYVNYGSCSGDIGVQDKIVISSDSQQAKFVRQSCADLNSPVSVAINDLEFTFDRAVFKLRGRVYDLQIPEPNKLNQPVTTLYCSSGDAASLLEARIWNNYQQPGATFGSVTNGTFSTGALVVASPGSNEYKTVTNQVSQFGLLVSGEHASLTYTFDSATGTSSNAQLNCASQSSPPAPVNTASGLPAPPGYAASPLLFEDRFLTSSLDTSKWIPQIADVGGIWPGGLPAPYTAAGDFNSAFFDPSHVLTGSGLQLVAIRDSFFPAYKWRSACITTHGLFSFQGGYVQIRARLPDVRSGIWPTIFFLEGGAEIDLLGAGYLGSASPNNMFNTRLAAPGNTPKLVDAGTDLSADYHVYGMEYRPGVSVSIFFDGVLQKTFTSNIPTGAFTIVIALQVSEGAGSWHTSVSDLTPSPSVWSISDVQVYRLPP